MTTGVCDVFYFEGVLELIGIHKRIKALNSPCYVLACIVKYMGVCVTDVFVYHTTKSPVLFSDIH